MSTAAAIAIVAGTAVNVVGQQKAASATKEAGRVSNAQQKTNDAAALRKQAREARVQRSRILAQAEATGGGGGSGAAGAISSISTQLGGSVANVAGQQNTANAITSLNQDAADARVLSAFGQAASSLGGQAFQATGGFDKLFGD